MDKNFSNPNSKIDPQTAEGRLALIEAHERGAYDGWAGHWPGDGSGMDDLADLNAREGLDS